MIEIDLMEIERRIIKNIVTPEQRELDIDTSDKPFVKEQMWAILFGWA